MWVKPFVWSLKHISGMAKLSETDNKKSIRYIRVVEECWPSPAVFSFAGPLLAPVVDKLFHYLQGQQQTSSCASPPDAQQAPVRDSTCRPSQHRRLLRSVEVDACVESLTSDRLARSLHHRSFLQTLNHEDSCVCLLGSQG